MAELISDVSRLIIRTRIGMSGGIFESCRTIPFGLSASSSPSITQYNGSRLSSLNSDDLNTRSQIVLGSAVVRLMPCAESSIRLLENSGRI